MQVCHLIKGLGRGGAEMLLPWLIEQGAAETTYSVGYFVPWKDQLVGAVEAAGARVRCFNARTPPALLLQVAGVARWLRAERADILHCHLPLAGVVGRLAASISRTPVVYTEHNLLERYHTATRRAELATWRLQRAVVAVSQEVAVSIARHTGSSVPVRVIRNGVPLSRWTEGGAPAGEVTALRERLAIDPTAPVVGTVAVLRSQKRIDLWLEAAAEVRRAVPAARFVIVGDGPLRAGLEERAAALGLSSAVVFAGLQTDVAPYLGLMDVYLSSSEFEGLPVALLEAMAARVPIVATDVGGISEVVLEGETGLLAPFGDPRRLAAAVTTLLTAPDRRVEMGIAARRRVEQEFDIKRMADALARLYRDVTGGVHDG